MNLRTMPALFTSFFLVLKWNYRKTSTTRKQLFPYFKKWKKTQSYLQHWGSCRSPTSHLCRDSSVKDSAKPILLEWSSHAHHHRSMHPKIFHICVEQKPRYWHHCKCMLHWQYICMILVLPPLISWPRSSNVITKSS